MIERVIEPTWVSEDGLVRVAVDEFVIQRNAEILGVLPQHLSHRQLVLFVAHHQRQQLVRGSRNFTSSSIDQTEI